MGLVKGIGFLHVQSFLSERVGPGAWADLLSMLPAADRAVVSAAAVSGWYDLGLLSRVLRAMDRRFGTGDLELCEALGRHQAERDLTTLHRWFFRVISPERAVRHMDMYWRKFHDTGRWTSAVRGSEVVAELSGWAVVDAALCRNVLGYIGRTLELIGGRDLTLEHTRCRAEGHGTCEFIGRFQLARTAPEQEPLSSRDVAEIGRALAELGDLQALGSAVTETLVRQFHCRRVRLWRNALNGAAAELLGSAGAQGPPASPCCFVLEAAGHALGRLEVDAPPAAASLLEELLPWLGIALDRARLSSARSAEAAARSANDGPEALRARLATAAQAWSLTRRQAEVLALIARGLTNKEIAAELGRQEGTVEIHVTQLLRKAGVENRAGLIAKLWAESRTAMDSHA